MNKKYTFVLVATLATLCTHLSYAQTSVAKETKILEQQRNLLSIADKKKSGKEKFEFDGCSCKYTYTSHTDKTAFNMSRTNEFDLKEISSVSYSKNENNSYELRLKLKTEDNPVTQEFDFSSINVNLNTWDEKQVKDIAGRFKNAVKTCSGK
jgi:hypothetical protein